MFALLMMCSVHRDVAASDIEDQQEAASFDRLRGNIGRDTEGPMDSKTKSEDKPAPVFDKLANRSRWR